VALSPGINPPGCEADHVLLVSRLISGAIPAIPVILIRGSPGFELTRASVPAAATQQTVRSNKRTFTKPVCDCDGVPVSFLVLVLKSGF